MHSWSDSTPAARYASSGDPLRPGAWPSTRRWPAASIFATRSGSPAITPGKFMTSATPIAPCTSSSARTSAASSSAPALSNGDAGTQLDAHTPNVNGRCAAASTSAATPGMPKTLAISCGSAATAVVPHGSTLRTNSSTQSFVDSRCMWESTNPGVSAAPPTSTTSRSRHVGPSPRRRRRRSRGRCRATRRVVGTKTRPPVSSRSAGSSPRAAARARVDAAGRVMAPVSRALR